ncbi:pleckstrin homology domain-containing family O member 2 [Tiliqua scincoides]|uniref:pleckstrin homology domain-containing family O member 2 n=1 Tax=Tiliqua scincoides TaxID=71010 RepID=UPI003461F394
MEDDVKEETPEKPKGTPTADKAGWIKKSSGGFLGLWKERYILLCKTQLLVYEDEDVQKCIETVELESYDKCQDLRALLKRRNRFILIRAPGYKVQDIKFQASSGEEKESWMKALNEGINRGKNKIFDEVKVDESLSLEHVTRGRAKMGHGRRPPTRSHLKEVANSVSEGILRLDLDVVDNGPPNAGLVTSETENDLPPKETLKPPMPPSKPLMPPAEKQCDDSTPDNPEVKKPPMPPTKPLKETEAPGENLSSVEEDVPCSGEGAEEPKVAPDGDNGENLTDTSKNTLQAPVPPPKILSDKMKVTVMWDSPVPESEGAEELSVAGSKENLHEMTQETAKPPAPPPKILSERLRASMNSHLDDLKVSIPDSHYQAGDSEPPENGINGDRETEPLSEEAVTQDGEEQRETPSVEGANMEGSSPPLKEQTPSSSEPVRNYLRGNSLPAKPRCASVGDLLMEPKKKPLLGQALQPEATLHIARMEKKVACEQERTEKLLQKVLQGELEQAREGNGPPVNAETLLNEAAAQLRQASQVLREIKDLGGLGKEPAEGHKGVTKDLATLYRRSAP